MGGVQCLPIPGSRRLSHALENISASKLELTSEDMQLLEDIGAMVAGERERIISSDCTGGKHREEHVVRVLMPFLVKPAPTQVPSIGLYHNNLWRWDMSYSKRARRMTRITQCRMFRLIIETKRRYKTKGRNGSGKEIFKVMK